MHATTIVAYVHNADLVCKYCMNKEMAPKVKALGLPVQYAETEWLLDVLAKHLGVNRENEHSFDSDVFPKVVFASDAGRDDSCGVCYEYIMP